MESLDTRWRLEDLHRLLLEAQGYGIDTMALVGWVGESLALKDVSKVTPQFEHTISVLVIPSEESSWRSTAPGMES